MLDRNRQFHFQEMALMENMETIRPEGLKQRISSRRPTTDAVITCRPYGSHGDTHSVEGVMRNVSREGACIETAHRFKPGTILIVRMVRYPSSRTDREAVEGVRSIVLAEVRWRKDRHTADGPIYGMGLRYFD